MSMTQEEVKEAVTFREAPCCYPYTKLIGSFSVHYEMLVDNEGLEMAKNRIKEGILRKLYDDQRNTLIESLKELSMCDPMNFLQWRTCVDKILNAAKYQPK